REVVHWLADYLLQLRLSVGDFVSQSDRVKIGEVGVSHRVTADFETLPAEFFELRCGKIARLSQPPASDEEGCIETGLPQDRSCCQKVRFAAIVERDGH